MSRTFILPQIQHEMARQKARAMRFGILPDL
jgi:hypothetical protein